MLSKKLFIILTIILHLFMVVGLQAQPPNKKQSSQRVKNVRFEQSGGIITITYNLLGDSSKEAFRIALRVSFDGGETFDIKPASLTGDVGSYISPGLDKQIIWDVLEDFPSGIRGQNIQFSIRAEEQNTSGNWLYYVLAGMLTVGIGTAASLALGTGGSADSGPSALPTPPARPNF